MRFDAFGAGATGGLFRGSATHERPKFEELVAEISSILLGTIDTMDNSIDLCLQSVAQFFDADQVCISEPTTAITATRLQTADNSLIDHLSTEATSSMPTWPLLGNRLPEGLSNRFLVRRGASYAGFDAYPLGVRRSDQKLRWQRISIPLTSSEEYLGELTLTMNGQGSIWGAEEKKRVRMLGSILSAALVRQRIDQELRGYAERTEATLREERDRANLYLEVAEVMLVVIDRDGVITLINRKGCVLLGYEEGELVGQNWFERCVPQRERTTVWDAFQQMLAGNWHGPDTHENKLLTRDGEERDFFFYNARLTDQSGEAIGVLSSGRDFTERKQARQALEASEQKYRSIFESLMDVFYRTSLTGIVEIVSPSVYRMLGYRPEEIIGNMATIFYDEDPSWRSSYVQQLLSSDVVNDFELKMRTRDGRTLDVSVNAHVIRDPSGSPVGFEGVLRDITERKKSESILQSLVRGTASSFGKPFFKSLVQSMSEGLGCRYVHIGEADMERHQVRTLAVWNKDRFDKNFDYVLSGSPCQRVAGQALFLRSEETDGESKPESWFGLTGVQSFLATSLVGNNGDVLGFLVVMDDRRMPEWVVEKAKALLVIAAARAAAELQRIRSDRDLRRTYEELQQASEKLKEDRVALTERNIALKMVLDHIEQEKEGYRQEICANLELALSPYVNKLKEANGKLGHKDVAALSDLVGSMVGHGVDSFQTNYAKLSPRETEICELIMEGHPSKDMSDILGIAVETIHKHREIIRRKLGIQYIEINLATYLRSKLK